MNRDDVFDAFLRIAEALRNDAQDHQRSIARHDLFELNLYLATLEAVMDDIQNQAKGWEVIPRPWELFTEKLDEVTQRAVGG